MPTQRFLVHLAARERQPIDPAEIYYLEAEDDTTTIRLRSSRPLVDTRSLGEIEPLLSPHGLLRIHRNHMVNLARIRVVRGRADSADWEVKLDPPVNRVLPISRRRLAAVWEVLAPRETSVRGILHAWRWKTETPTAPRCGCHPLWSFSSQSSRAGSLRTSSGPCRSDWHSAPG